MRDPGTVARLLSRLYRSSPQEIVDRVAARMRSSRAPRDDGIEQITQDLRTRFSVYRTANLRTIDPTEFEAHIRSKLGSRDPESEGYSEYELERQRDPSITFLWGHDHDFGEFRVAGRMHERHVTVLARLLALFSISLDGFRDKRVFDIGCWTGGTTLLLAALGSEVFAIEEVKKYADMAAFLAHSFGLDDSVRIRPLSIYDCNLEDLHDRFDVVFFPGVVYHLTDPVLALRILYNSLKIGGIILVESAGVDSREPVCRFEGSLVQDSAGADRLQSAGWNWFVPSASALSRMMSEAGFAEVDARWNVPTRRVYACGKKLARVGICRAGLSDRSIA